MTVHTEERTVRIPPPAPLTGGVELVGDLTTPAGAAGVVVFAHGSGSSRHSPRNRWVAEQLQRRGLATLLLDLLTTDEEEVDLRTRHLRFDVGLLAGRLATAAGWVRRQPGLDHLPIAYFGASTGAAAALIAAAEHPAGIRAIVSRGGRPDLAGDRLARVRAATLLIVGGADEIVLDLNRQAQAQLSAEAALHVVPGATHLFEERGALAEVAGVAGRWLTAHLGSAPAPAGGAR